jgi:hypothetical protein
MNRGFIRRRWLHCVPLVAVVAVGAHVGIVRAQEGFAGSRSLDRRLDQSVTIAWQGEQLGPALERLAASQKFPLWIDRRVDTSTPVDLAISNQPVRAALETALASHDLAAVDFHGVLYVGPRQSADELPTLSAIAMQSVSKAPAAGRAGWLKTEAWSFPRLSEPRALLSQLADAAGSRLHDEQLMPHDLWPARSLPAMPAIDRAVLLLVGFDLTPKLSADGRQLEVLGIRRPVALVNSYIVSRARLAAVKAALAEAPDAKVEWNGARLTLVARAAAHQSVKRAITETRPSVASRRPPPSSRTTEQRFTLKIDNQPVGAVIDQLARQLQLDVQWDLGIGAGNQGMRAMRVSCDVHDADLDELLSAVLTPAGLAFKRQDKTVAIEPAAVATAK